MGDSPDLGITDMEREALHELQLGVEHVYRGYGSLLEFHHTIGHGMDHLDDAQEKLREAGHTDLADRLRDEHVPAGVFEEAWTYELVEAFKRDLLADLNALEGEIREQLADGREHITERRQQQTWRERAREETDHESV